MTIAKGRNEIQASIEDYAQILNTLACEIDAFYKDEIKKINTQIKLLILENSDEDSEIVNDIISPQNELIDLYENLRRQAFEMLVSKIYSYVEKHIEELLKRISYTRNKSINKYKKEHVTTQGISDIEKHFYVIQQYYQLSRNIIPIFLTDFEKIHKLRNDIEHHYTYSWSEISIEFIKKNIEQAKDLLLHIEKITRN